MGVTVLHRPSLPHPLHTLARSDSVAAGQLSAGER